jgi:myosin-5
MLKKDNKALLDKVESFDNQVKNWRQKHANLENRNKELQLEANQAGIAAARLAQMDEEMKNLQAQFEESTANMKRLQEEGKSLRKSLTQRTSELDQLKSRDKAHEDEKLSLRQQIQVLEDQLQHASSREEENGHVEKSSGGITNGLINYQQETEKTKRRLYGESGAGWHVSVILSDSTCIYDAYQSANATSRI